MSGGLYEVLSPGSSVIKTDAYRSIIKEPGNVQSPLETLIWLNLELRQRDKQIYKFMPTEDRKHHRERSQRILLTSTQERQDGK